MSNAFWESAIQRTCNAFGIEEKFVSHQWKNSTWIFNNLKKKDGVLLGDGVGTGKTYSALFGALHYFIVHKPKKQGHKKSSVLIICPNPAVISKWKKDIYYVDPNKPNLIDYVEKIWEGKNKAEYKTTLKGLLDEGNIVYLSDIQKKGKKEKLINDTKHKIIFATTHDIHRYFRGKSNDIKMKLEEIIQIVIIDEAHKLKQRKFEEITKEGAFLPKSKKILLTATPFQKEAGELKKLLRIIDKKKEGDAENFERYRSNIDSYKLEKLKRDKKALEEHFRKYIAVTNRNFYKVKVFINNNNIQDFDHANLDDLFKNLSGKKPIDSSFYLEYLKKRAEFYNDDEMLTYQRLSLVLSKGNANDGNHPKVALLKKILKKHFSIASDNLCCKPVIFAGMNVGEKTIKNNTEIKGLHQYLQSIVTDHYQSRLKKIIDTGTGKSKMPNFYRILGKIYKEFNISTKTMEKLLEFAGRLSEALRNSMLYRFHMKHNTKIESYYNKEFAKIARQYCDCCSALKSCQSQFINVKAFDTQEEFKEFMQHRRKHLWETLEAVLPGNNLVETYSSKESQYLRKKSLDAFQHPLEPFALIVSNAGSEGLDMQNYTKGCIHYDMTWSPGLMVQRNGRINRIGKKCFNKQAIENHYLIIPNTYDERIFAALQKRMKALSLMIPIDVESKSLFVDIDSNVGRNLNFDLEP